MAAENRAMGSSRLFTRLCRHKYTGLAVNALPASIWLTVFFFAPLAVMLVR